MWRRGQRRGREGKRGGEDGHVETCYRSGRGWCGGEHEGEDVVDVFESVAGQESASQREIGLRR